MPTLLDPTDEIPNFGCSPEAIAAASRGQMVALPNGSDVRTDPGNPLVMLATALDRGTDPAKLEKLMDLADRWKAQQAEADFALAMNEAQSLMPCIVRDGVNPFLKTRYAKLETVNTAVKPVAAQHGFSLSFGDSESPKGPEWTRVVCDVSHVGGHTRRYHLDCPLDGAGMKGGQNKSGMQAIGSTLTYARRYLTLLIFNITVADEDLDGQTAESFACISEQESLEIEDLIRDKAANLPKFIDWLKSGGMCVGEPGIRTIAAKHFARVVKTLQQKKGPGER